MAKTYTTKTAALKATIADINKIDAKKMLLNGKNILDYIGESGFSSYDTRDPQLKNDELDIWNAEISLSEEGHIEVKPFEHTCINDYEDSLLPTEQITAIRSAHKIINNEVLGDNDVHLMYWQTDGLTEQFGTFSPAYTHISSENLSTFHSDLSSLTNGFAMFERCLKLTSFQSDLSSLTDGVYMFEKCAYLTSFTTDMPKLTNGYYMFDNCLNLTEFDSDLSALDTAYNMFQNCNKLVSFHNSLHNLSSGIGMFRFCSSLESFNSDLPCLTNGTWMFSYCKLDATSVANIVHTLPTNETNVNITIGIGCDNTEADKLLFAQECDCETWQELLDDFSAKNWTVHFELNGRPTTTYNMRRGETLPIYAKLEEVTEGEHYSYTSTDGSKFYNINYFHSTNGSTEGYDVFSSLEEAISTYNVTPKN